MNLDNLNYKRGEWDEIVLLGLPANVLEWVRNLVSRAGSADHIDEHGSWEFGIEGNGKGTRWSALNWSLYAVGLDHHSGKPLAIVQIRQSEKRSSRFYLNIRKSYFLLGENEDDTVFAHPVSANCVRRAVRDGGNIILKVQNWIFGGDYTRMVRQGDLAILPLGKKPNLKEATEFHDGNWYFRQTPSGSTRIQIATLQESHELHAEQIWQNGNLYALNPFMRHLPETHPPIQAEGWCKVIVGQRGKFYRFAAPTID